MPRSRRAAGETAPPGPNAPERAPQNLKEELAYRAISRLRHVNHITEVIQAAIRSVDQGSYESPTIKAGFLAIHDRLRSMRLRELADALFFAAEADDEWIKQEAKKAGLAYKGHPYWRDDLFRIDVRSDLGGLRGQLDEDLDRLVEEMKSFTDHLPLLEAKIRAWRADEAAHWYDKPNGPGFWWYNRSEPLLMEVAEKKGGYVTRAALAGKTAWQPVSDLRGQWREVEAPPRLP